RWGENGHLMITSRLAAFTMRAVLVPLTLLYAASASAQQCPDAAALTRSISGPLATVRYLADDALEGRLAGSPGERCAGDFLAAQFRQLGLRPGGANNTFFQTVPLASVLNPHASGGTGRNVIALLPGSDARLNAEWIVIGAHYDHLGRGAFSSAAPDQKNAIHNGADDNASGVSVMLEVARRLSATRPARSVAFIAFTGEEAGLLGSAQFVAEPTIPLARTRAMLNMDMVGRLSTGALIVNGTGTATELDGLVRRAAAAERIDYTAQPGGYGPSDHTSFYMKDIPVLFFFTNVHGDYHKPSDDWEKIDAGGLERMAGLVTRIAQSLAGSGPALTIVRGVGKPEARADASPGYGAYLGTVPDFRPVPKGVPLSGVTPGSPADKAGLRGGDVLIRFDQEDIADLQGMTDALRKRKPGDAVRVTVLRDGQEVVLNAVLGRRSQ
ncbi:MAG: M20/M25/M40 family metallo-hydrolase, partial [Longimicrobiales bacterium]